MPRPRIPIANLRGLILLVAIAALGLAPFVVDSKARQREQRLLAELRAERSRAQGFHRLAQLAIGGKHSLTVNLDREFAEETARFQAEAARHRHGAKGFLR